MKHESKARLIRLSNGIKMQVGSMVAVAQLVRAPVCGTGGCGFNSRQPPLKTVRRASVAAFTAVRGGGDRFRSVAQLVEHRSPKPAVGGSIPSGPVALLEGFLPVNVRVVAVAALSSRGLGRGPLKAQTRVRIPLALLMDEGCSRGIDRPHRLSVRTAPFHGA